jgi:hypothetical protein
MAAKHFFSIQDGVLYRVKKLPEFQHERVSHWLIPLLTTEYLSLQFHLTSFMSHTQQQGTNPYWQYSLNIFPAIVNSNQQSREPLLIHIIYVLSFRSTHIFCFTLWPRGSENCTATESELVLSVYQGSNSGLFLQKKEGRGATKHHEGGERKTSTSTFFHLRKNIEIHHLNNRTWSSVTQHQIWSSKIMDVCTVQYTGPNPALCHTHTQSKYGLVGRLPNHT